MAKIKQGHVLIPRDLSRKIEGDSARRICINNFYFYSLKAGRCGVQDC